MYACYDVPIAQHEGSVLVRESGCLLQFCSVLYNSITTQTLRVLNIVYFESWHATTQHRTAPHSTTHVCKEREELMKAWFGAAKAVLILALPLSLYC